MTLKRILRWLLITIASVPLVLFLLYKIEILLGFYPGYPGWKVAEIAATKKDVSICQNIINLPWIGFGPLVGESQMTCIHHYAESTKDPSACELLMPSSYGLSCVGGAGNAPICGINTGFEVQWHEGDQIKRSSLRDCQKNNGRSKRGDECCIIASVSGIRNFNDCSSLAMDTPLFDNCLNELAFKNHDPSSCAQIKNDKIRLGCIISAKALQKDPSICTGCTPAVESVDQLPK